MKKKSNFTYWVGGDQGQDLGPFALEQVQQLITEQKVVGSTFVRRNDQEHWATAAEFPELKLKDEVHLPQHDAFAPDPLAAEMELTSYLRTVRIGGSWFFWITALSLINSFLSVLGAKRGYALGLGLNYLVTEALADASANGRWLALAANLAICALFFFFGVAAWKGWLIPFWIGWLIYLADTVFVAMSGEWISIGIHCVALGFLSNALRANLSFAKVTLRPQFWATGGVSVALALALGFGLFYQFKYVPAEPWISVTQEKWPRLVMRHEAEFKGHTALNGGSACLLELPSKQIVAATALHLLTEDGGVVPDLPLTNLTQAIVKWTLVGDQASANARPKVLGLFGAELDYPEATDWLLLTVDTSSAPAAGTVLKTRANPIKVGERAYLVGIPNTATNNRQEVLAASVVRTLDGLVFFKLDKPAALEGFSGGPVLDARGRVIAVTTGAPAEGDDQGRVPGFIGHSIHEIKSLVRRM